MDYRAAVANLAPPVVKAVLWRAWRGEAAADIAAAVQIDVRAAKAVLWRMRKCLGPAQVGAAMGRGRPARELGGQRFGRLTVLERAASRGAGRKAWWRCRCDCGVEAELPGTRLVRGETRSCGCLRRERASTLAKERQSRPRAAVDPFGERRGHRRHIDLAGQRFGRLVVMLRVPGKATVATWLCRCDCGVEKAIRSDCLRRGQTRSCGCLKRKRAAAPMPVPVAARRSPAGAAKDNPRYHQPGGRPTAHKPQARDLAAVWRAQPGFDEAERAAIAAAEKAGRKVRIEQGEFPDAGRTELLKYKSPAVRRQIARSGE